MLVFRDNEILPGGAFVGESVVEDLDENAEGPGAVNADRVPVPEGISQRIRNLYLLELDLRGQLQGFLHPASKQETAA